MKAIERKDAGPDTGATARVCREVSIKDICEDCERTTLYPEENCGYPTTLLVCEDLPVEASGRRKKQERGK
ncbi:MAG: hypothetical protein ACE5GY_06300 [Thermodesulfobacteriota bacterium]